MPPRAPAEAASVPPEAVTAPRPQGALRPAPATRSASARRVLSLAVDDRDRRASEAARATTTAAAAGPNRDRSLPPSSSRIGSGRAPCRRLRGERSRQQARPLQRQYRRRSRPPQGFEHRRLLLLSGSAGTAKQARIRGGRLAAGPAARSRLCGYRPAATEAQRAQRLAAKRRPLRLSPLASVQLVKSGTQKRSVLSAGPSPLSASSSALFPAIARAYGQTLGHASTRALARNTVRVSGLVIAQTAILTFRLSAFISVQTYRLSLHLARAFANWQRARRQRIGQRRRQAEEAARQKAEAAALAASQEAGESSPEPTPGEAAEDLSGTPVNGAVALNEETGVEEGVTIEEADRSTEETAAAPAPAETGADREATAEEADGSLGEETPPAAADLPTAPVPTAAPGKPPPQTLPYSFCRRYGVLIERDAGDHLVVLRRAGGPVEALLEIHRITGGVQLKVREIPEEEFSETLNRYYESGSWQSLDMMDGIGDELDLNQIADSLPEPSDLMESDDEAPVIRLINAMLTEAIRKNASDIHVEPFEKRLEVRFRIDGVMHRLLEPPREIGPMLTSRIKVMANLDIAEKRVPQDGRISLRVAGRPVDVRVSSLPSGHGERVVMRLLNKEKGRLDLDYLGMEEEVQGRLKDLLKMPHGILLITGPTGSGKTTTLYSGLTWLNDSSNTILTIEDPIEYYLDGIGQTQVNTKVNLTFARGLRAILRQDPDIVMVGEIRDLETAEIAVQASLTGHLVLSTLHTNTAIGAVTRLQDMGVESFLLSTSLVGVVSQRLVRVLCDRCRKPARPAARECDLLGIDAKDARQRIYHPVGCDHCTSGYAGRTAIYEVVALDDKMRDLIHSGAGENDLERYAHSIYPSIFDNGRKLVLQGNTTLEELLRVTRN